LNVQQLKFKKNKELVGCDAPLDRYINKMTYEPSKLGQTYQVFCFDRSLSVDLSVYTRLPVSVQCLWFMPPWLTDRHTDGQLLTGYTIHWASWAKTLVI